METIKQIITRQLEGNKNKNLLYKEPGEILNIDSDFINKLQETKANTIISIDEQLVEYTASELIKAIYRVNQFIQVSPDSKEALKDIYRNSWLAIIKSTDIKECLYKHHYPSLSGWLASLYPPLIKEYLKNQKETGSIVCEEYTPGFQLQILHLDVNLIQQPVLDIGCGKNANLVKYLRDKSIEAYGIDRMIEKENDFLFNADWLSYNFDSRKWGTIISNAAFSNHVMYTAKYEPGKLKEYLLKYYEIINSLMPGGEFIYAPGLPFIEERLDRDKYEVDRFEITGEYCGIKINRKIISE